MKGNLHVPFWSRAGVATPRLRQPVRDNLEAFGDEFERLARTPEQRQLAAAFQQFVGEFTGTGPKDAYRQMLAEAASATPKRDKDIER